MKRQHVRLIIANTCSLSTGLSDVMIEIPKKYGTNNKMDQKVIV